MRLFTAVTFDESILDELAHFVENFQQFTKRGSFTRKENFHITVNFIGETNQLEEVKKAMDLAISKVNAEPFLLRLGELGRFKRKEGDIYWIGVEKDNTLWSLQKELLRELKELGFDDMDDREFHPHLTLGRKVYVNENFNITVVEKILQPMTMEVSKISLMKSEQIEGKLTYTEIYHVDL